MKNNSNRVTKLVQENLKVSVEGHLYPQLMIAITMNLHFYAYLFIKIKFIIHCVLVTYFVCVSL